MLKNKKTNKKVIKDTNKKIIKKSNKKTDKKNNNKNQILEKGDFVINPITNRPVKIGNPAWLALVRQGLVDGTYKDKKIVAIVPNEDELINNYPIDEIKKEISKNLPFNLRVVKGTGQYKNKLITKHKYGSLKKVDLDKVNKSKYTTEKINNDSEIEYIDSESDELESDELDELDDLEER